MRARVASGKSSMVGAKVLKVLASELLERLCRRRLWQPLGCGLAPCSAYSGSTSCDDVDWGVLRRDFVILGVSPCILQQILFVRV